jgi:hypothetical protein
MLQLFAQVRWQGIAAESTIIQQDEATRPDRT